ncbi:hypothetical protein ONZ43_g3743 [Nemania bipapillata]|uniref:Uncharacterized protein n=1 Tax=Nemania bipapillata TaxID=110536 RepID=A0ACC2IVZ2_9PEZI|nr:hypothetical protein ONZ43_g3743 [Nemania bipapillata]
MGRLPLVRSLAIAFLTSAVIGQEICTTEQAPNLLTDPSWEAGTAGWTYISPGGTFSTSSSYASDGQSSLLIPATASYALIEQTLSNLVVGEQYTISIDLQGVISQAYSVSEQCIVYLFHDALSSTNLIASKLIQFNHNTNTGWQTIGGTYTATSSNLMFGFYTYCTPYKTAVIFNAYLDNAVLDTPAVISSAIIISPSTPFIGTADVLSSGTPFICAANVLSPGTTFIRTTNVLFPGTSLFSPSNIVSADTPFFNSANIVSSGPSLINTADVVFPGTSFIRAASVVLTGASLVGTPNFVSTDTAFVSSTSLIPTGTSLISAAHFLSPGATVWLSVLFSSSGFQLPSTPISLFQLPGLISSSVSIP